MIKHFRNKCGRLSFVIQTLEILPGTRYKNNNHCSVERAKTFKGEDYCMNTLRTIYPYGLNQKPKKHNRGVPVRKIFLSMPRTKSKSARYRNNNDYLKNDTIKDFFTNIQNIIHQNIKRH